MFGFWLGILFGFGCVFNLGFFVSVGTYIFFVGFAGVFLVAETELQRSNLGAHRSAIDFQSDSRYVIAFD